MLSFPPPSLNNRATGILTDHTILSTQIETLAGNIQVSHHCSRVVEQGKMARPL